MSTPEVGSGKVSIFPTFTGFRRAVTAEVDGSTRVAGSRFTSGFRSAGTQAGRGFSASFRSASSSVTSDVLKRATADVAKASREVATVRLRELDAAGKVRIAEASLGEARSRYAANSSQVVRAEERLAASHRALASVQEGTAAASDRLTSAKRALAAATTEAATAAGRSGGAFGRLGGIMSAAGGDGARRFSQGFRDVLGGVLGANILTGIGYTIGRGIGSAARAGFAYVVGSIGFASDVEQQVGAVTQVFKSQATEIDVASRSSARSIGLARADFLRYATVVGAQLKNLGIPTAQVSGRTQKLIELGADLAAQFGGPTSQAVEALSSLLRGERDPIERYGVSIKQAGIDAEVARMGLSGLTGEAQRQAEIQATLALLYKQTADAQGTFAREADTFAGKQQRFLANLSDAQAGFGEALLPTATEALSFANDELLPILRGALDEAGPVLATSLRDHLPEIKATLKEAADSLPAAIATAEAWAEVGASFAEAVRVGMGGDIEIDGVEYPTPLEIPKFFGKFGDLVSDQFAEAFKPDNGRISKYMLEDVAAVFGPDSAISKALNTAAGSNVSSYAQGFATADGWARTQQTAADEVSRIAEMTRTGGGGSFAEAGVTLGKGFGDGLAEGIRSKQAKVGLASAALANAANTSLKLGLDSRSPSRKARALGVTVPEGLALGMEDGLHLVTRSAGDLADAALARVGSRVAVTASTTAGSGASSAGGSSGPATFNLYDVSGELIARMRGEASQTFEDKWAMKKIDAYTGGPV